MPLSKGGRPGKKPRDKRGPGSKKKKTKLPSIKNQIRGVQRLLAKEGLDPKVRQKQEARLQELLEAKQQHERAERERKYAKRYHKVRFFERVKIERQLHKLQRQQQLRGAVSKEDQAQLEQLKEDLEYVLHFPKGEKYVSLLKDAEEPEEQARLVAERARLRVLVKRQLAEAALVAEADEGRSLVAAAAAAARGKKGVAAGGGGAVTGGSGAGGVEEPEEEPGVGSDDDFFLHSSDEEDGGQGEEEEQQGASARRQQQEEQQQAAAQQQEPVSAAEEPRPAGTGSSGEESEDLASSDVEGPSSCGELEESGGEDEGPAAAIVAPRHQPRKPAAERGQGMQGPGQPRAAAKRTQGKQQRQQQERGQQQARQRGGAPSKLPRQTGQQQQGWGGPAEGSGQGMQARQRERQQQGKGQRAQGLRREGLAGREGSGLGQERGKEPRKAGHGAPPRKPGARPGKQQQRGGGKGKRVRPEAEKEPLRTRAEGGRKRRKKSKD